jgi:hypothetical protein
VHRAKRADIVTRSGALEFLKTSGATVLAELVVNFAAPYAIYIETEHRLGDVRALIASSVPPILWSLAEFVRKRRMDALSLLVLAGIALSLLAFLGGGSARFLQLRENFVTVFTGLVFLGSVALRRPLIYQLARATVRRQSQAELASFDALRDNTYFRRTMTVMTLVWGAGLLGAAAASCALLFVVSIGTYLLVSPAVNYGAMGALGLWTFWYAKRQRRKGDERRAALAAESEGSQP